MVQDSDRLNLCAFGAEIILNHLNALEKEIEGVRRAEDIEYIHRMRVASRRLRNALTIFADCFPPKKITIWQNSIRKITRSLGLARDTDVQLELLNTILVQVPEKRYRPGIRRLLIRLTQRRQKLQSKVNSALDELEQSKTIPLMRERLEILISQVPEQISYSHALYLRARQVIIQKLDDMLAYEPYIYDPNRLEELHAMRISAKKLRYTLETFAPLYSNMLKKPVQAARQIQEMLGIIHDCDVWIITLPEFIADEKRRTIRYYGYSQPFNLLLPGIQFFLSNRQETRHQEYRRFLSEWARWKKTALWEKLRQTITHPLTEVTEIYPPASQVSVEAAIPNIGLETMAAPPLPESEDDLFEAKDQ